MYVKPFLAYSIPSIDYVLDDDIIDIVNDSKYESISAKMISPQCFGDICISESIDAGDEEWCN